MRTDEVDWGWTPEELRGYIQGNYGEGVIREDWVLGSVAIAALAVHAHDQGLFGTLSRAAHLGAGGVPRGSAILAPLMSDRDEGGKIVVSDLGADNVAETRKVMEDLARGRLGKWQPHQDKMSRSNHRWRGSFRRAGRLAVVEQCDIRDLPPKSQQAVAMEYVAESMTADPHEHAKIMEAVCDGLEPGGVLYTTYMIGSDGYLVGDKVRPAVPVTVDYIGKVLRKNGMDIIFNGGTDASHQARIEGDPHAYDGMGVAVALRRSD